MRLRARFTLRNDVLISAREKRGWSQKKLSEETNVPFLVIRLLEKLDYSKYQSVLLKHAVALSKKLKVSLEDILPEDFFGKDVSVDKVVKKKVNPKALLEARDSMQRAMYFPSPDEALREEEVKELLWKYVKKLTPAKRRILKRLWGLNGEKAHSLGEVSKLLKVSVGLVSHVNRFGITKVLHLNQSDIKKNPDKKILNFLEYLDSDNWHVQRAGLSSEFDKKSL